MRLYTERSSFMDFQYFTFVVSRFVIFGVT
ncbi:hypothetical protein MDG893_10406 [Marinobacter algicola DG893]|uniref:Uncharacterized protein n=1 Tax=Marinobacter algicola DG893 TaxID=443152 RepID=A6EUV6_9GAMM|nr:hypothetical protein MDG893_10406 [Marinobacter algicola DG893]